MKSIYVRHVTVSAISAITLLAAGCASVAVSNEAINTNTASALGIDKATFTIYDREDNGIKSTYKVKTDAGKKYNCYVTGSVSLAGPAVSDAMCHEVGKTVKQTSDARTEKTCNALLKSAGKC